MTKKSLSRKQKDAQLAGRAPAARQVYVPPTAMIHPMFSTKLKEIKAEQAQEEALPVWDEVNSLYIQCVKGVMSPAILGKLAQRKDIISHIRDQNALNTRINMFKRDILTLKEELSVLHQEHSGKVGTESDPNEIMRAITISEKYTLFLQKLEATIPPTVAHIIEIFTEAELLMQQHTANVEAAAKDAAIDPNVITDVEVKEIVETKDQPTLLSAQPTV